MLSPTPPPPLLRSSRTATATRRDVSCQQRPPLNNVATSSWAKPPPSLLPVEMHNTARSIHLLQHPHPHSNGVAMSATNSAPSPLSNNVATSTSSPLPSHNVTIRLLCLPVTPPLLKHHTNGHDQIVAVG
uniref:Uncharacterized protein n=1 Tax=Zea mays TaxID=4577 RepID=A0A804QL01_MAIZE